jgi:hypothetical protein
MTEQPKSDLFTRDTPPEVMIKLARRKGVYNLVGNQDKQPKKIFWDIATPRDFQNIETLDWIEGVGDVSTPYEKEFIRQFGIALQQGEYPLPIITPPENQTPPSCMLNWTDDDGALWMYGCNKACLSCMRKDECLKMWIDYKEHETTPPEGAALESLTHEQEPDCIHYKFCWERGGFFNCPHSNKQEECYLNRYESRAAIAQAAREKVLEENMALIRDVILKDQSGLAEALAKVQTLAKRYDWIPAGEWGSYDYTQRTVETLQKECGYLLAEIERIAYEGLRDSGNRVIAHVRSCEKSLRQHKEQS